MMSRILVVICLAACVALAVSTIVHFAASTTRHRQPDTLFLRRVVMMSTRVVGSNNKKVAAVHRRSFSRNANVSIALPWPPWGSKKLTVVPDGSLCVSPRADIRSSCTFIHRPDGSNAARNASVDVIRAVDAIVIDENGKMAEDKKQYYDPTRNELGKIQVLWVSENWRGRQQEWGAKFRSRWLNKTDSASFWSSFHITTTIETSSSVPFRYAHVFPQRDKELEELRSYIADIPKLNESEAIFISSNCFTRLSSHLHWLNHTRIGGKFPRHRDDIVKQLMANGLNVSAYGACVSNRNDSMKGDGCDMFPKLARYCAIGRHLFHLSFENSIYNDYVTEKLYDPLLVRTIPVYLGAPNVENFVPTSNVLINFRDFDSTEDLVQYLHCVARNSTVREKYLEWRRRPVFRSWVAMTDPFSLPLCGVCRQVLDIAHGAAPLRGVAPPTESSSDVIPENRGSQRPIPCS